MVYEKKISITKNIMKKYLLFMLMAFVGMTAFAQESDDDDDNDNEEDAVETSSPCDNKWGADSAETAKNLSLFNQYYQEKNYAASYPYWLYLFENAPCIQKRITYNGSTVIKAMLKDVKAKQGKDAYYARIKTVSDTLFMTHQKRIEFFGQEGYVKGKWANEIVKLTP